MAKTFGFIGAGNMGGALIRAAAANNTDMKIAVFDVFEDKAREYAASYKNVSFADGVFSFERIKNGNGYKILINADKCEKQVKGLQNSRAEMGYVDKNGVILAFGFAILKIK